MNKHCPVDLAGVEELPEEGFIIREHRDTQILLARFEGEVYAVENLCSHAFARFDDARLVGARLRCPLHGADFDIRSGEALGRPARGPIRSFPVVVEQGRVIVDVST